MNVLDGFAAQLAADGFGVYRTDAPYLPDEVGIVIGAAPAEPQKVVALTTYTGPDDTELLGYDHPNVQIRVRGTADERVSRELAQAIYDRYVGATQLVLPDDTRVVLILGLQGGPLPLGRDAAGHHEHTVNLNLDYRNATEHRE